MNKDEILQMSRKENEGKASEWEISVANNASRAGKAVGISVCVILALLDDMFLHSRIIGLVAWIVFFSMESAIDLVLYLSYKKKGKLVLFFIDLFCVIADLSMLLILSKR